MLRHTICVALVLFAVSAAQSRAEHLTYYIGKDVHPVLNYYEHADNSYVGMANPNYGRLTFLYAHWLETPPYPVQANHFHGRSNYFYTGGTESPAVVSETADNTIPEYYTGYSPLKLRLADSGTFVGKLTSYTYSDTSEETGEEGHYSDLTIGTVHELDGFTATSAEYWMRWGNKGKVGGATGPTASFGRYSGSLSGSTIAVRLVSMTPGLHLGIESDLDVFDTGDVYTLGDGMTFRFDPTFWVDPDAAVGTYRASLVFTDLNGATTGVLDSGVINLDFRVVPEPATLSLLGAGFFLTLRRRVNRRP